MDAINRRKRNEKIKPLGQLTPGRLKSSHY